MDCMSTSLTFPTNSKGPFLNRREFCTTKGMINFENFPGEVFEAPLCGIFLTKRMKMLSRPNGFMLYGKLGVVSFSTFELLYENMQNRSRLNRARPNFYMTSNNPISLGHADCSL